MLAILIMEWVFVKEIWSYTFLFSWRSA